MQYRLPQQHYPEDPSLYATGDQRPNTGLREGLVEHEEVNDTIRMNRKTVIFGQQTRLRNGVMMPDEKLDRFHAGHDIVKFFYSAVRQLPPYLVDALLDNNVSVTLVQGPSLLVFHHSREHQSFHVGRTRRTIYIPEKVLREAYEKGYDYWAISEVLIQEAWPLLDYLMILETVRRLQEHLKSHYTLGYYIIKDTLRNHNEHLRETDKQDDEFGTFFRYYADQLYSLKPTIRERDPYDIADEIFDENRERFWSHLKLYDICEVYNYPTYFAIDRDICHGAAFRLAGELNLQLQPQTTAEVMHDLWDEARFKLSRSVKTEELLEQLIAMGAEGIKAFVETVAEEIVYGLNYVTANRYDGFDITAGFKRLLQKYSGSVKADVPGSMGHGYNSLYQYYLQLKRYEFFNRYKTMDSQAQEENSLIIREMLYRVIETRLRHSQAPDFKRRVEFAGSARILIDVGEGLFEKPDPEEETDHLCSVLAQLDLHPLYHTQFLQEYRELSGNEHIVLKAHIAPEIQRLTEYLPKPPHAYSSDPSGVNTRFIKFEKLRAHDPDNQDLFALIAALFVRLDQAENYPEILQQIRGLGEYARPPLEEIVANADLFADQQRGPIRDTSRQLLAEI
ncbi:MAG: hypothetical protein HOA27_29120 [Gemmatimonadetes bacterium]|nr:hypothetical protein [Gemmatimonadota bacterium]MBT7584540.1 hypothetical protein [Gemmatimonadota bacterium]